MATRPTPLSFIDGFQSNWSERLLKCPIPDIQKDNQNIQLVQKHVKVPQTLKEIIASKSRELSCWDPALNDIQLYAHGIILLQTNYCVIYNENKHINIWIINMNLTSKKTGKILYTVADETDKYGYSWILRNDLFSADEIVKKFINCINFILPDVLINTEEFKNKKNDIEEMEKRINTMTIQNSLFGIKIRWQKTKIIVNDRECNKKDKRETFSKQQFLTILKTHAASAYIRLVPILSHDVDLNKITCGYTINGLWWVEMSDNLCVGIAFTTIHNNVIRPAAIYVSLRKMRVNTQLTGESAQYASIRYGWIESKTNNLLIGNRNDSIQKCKVLEHNAQGLKKENEVYKLERQVSIHDNKVLMDENDELKFENGALKDRINIQTTFMDFFFKKNPKLISLFEKHELMYLSMAYETEEKYKQELAKMAIKIENVLNKNAHSRSIHEAKELFNEAEKNTNNVSNKPSIAKQTHD